MSDSIEREPNRHISTYRGLFKRFNKYTNAHICSVRKQTTTVSEYTEKPRMSLTSKVHFCLSPGTFHRSLYGRSGGEQEDADGLHACSATGAREGIPLQQIHLAAKARGAGADA